MDSTLNERQAKMRARRKAEGWQRVETWVKPQGVTPKQARAFLEAKLKDLVADKELSDSTKLAIFKADMWSLLSDMDWE